VLAEHCAREGLEGDKINEAVVALRSCGIFDEWSGDQIADTWLRLKDEVIGEDFAAFVEAVVSQVDQTTKARIIKVCFDLVALNPMLDAKEHFLLKYLTKSFGMPSTVLHSLWKQTAALQEYEPYINELLGITMDVPKRWLLSEDFGSMHVLRIRSPRTNTLDQFAESISLAFDEEAKVLDLNEFYIQGVEDWMDICKDFVLVKEGEFKTPEQGIRSRWMLFTGTAPKWKTPLTVKFFSFVSEKHTLRYTLMCRAMHEAYHDHDDVFDHVARSLVIKRN